MILFSVEKKNKNILILLEKMDETKALLDEDERVHSISCGALHTLVKTGNLNVLIHLLFLKTRINYFLVASEKHMP